jgi:hypothetical protein
LRPCRGYIRRRTCGREGREERISKPAAGHRTPLLYSAVIPPSLSNKAPFPNTLVLRTLFLCPPPPPALNQTHHHHPCATRPTSTSLHHDFFEELDRPPGQVLMLLTANLESCVLVLFHWPPRVDHQTLQAELLIGRVLGRVESAQSHPLVATRHIQTHRC